MNSKIKKAISLYENKKLNKAEEICLEILKEQPNHFESLRLLSLICYLNKNFSKALEFINKAIKIDSNHAASYNDRGGIFFQLKKIDEAVESYDRAIKIKPNLIQAYKNRGIALLELKKLNAAIENYDELLKIKPDNAEAYLKKGNALRELKLLDSALQNYENAIKIKPDYAAAYSNRGLVLHELKKIESAIVDYNKAIKINPNYAYAYNNLGNALLELRQLKNAIQNYEKAIKIEPNFFEAHYNLGLAFQELNQLSSAIKSWENAIEIKPNLDFLSGLLFFTKSSLCNWVSFKNDLEKLKKQTLNGEKVLHPDPALSFYESTSLQKMAAEIWVKENFSIKNILAPIPKRQPSKRIRLGYYSADFRNHAVSYQSAHLFELHDKSRFELIAFSFGPISNDEMNIRISSTFDKFINVQFKSDKEIAKLSRELKIDIAIDLSGFTKHNRFGIFLERCAPIQVSYLGYSGTVGNNCIDYLIADKILIPKENQKDYSGKIIYLPNSYMVNDSTKKISDKVFTRNELSLPNEGFIFCCFNKFYKITPNVFDTWMRILKNVQNSVLWLNEDNLIGAENLQKEAKKRGVDSNRLIFAKRMQSLDEHLARHRVADLFIDTFPFGAHTTCSDALWTGLPVLTRAGQSFASRVGASLLNAIDLHELITNTEKEYENMAIELSTKSEKLKKIKEKLKDNKNTTPLFDTKLFTKNIESAYIKMNEKYLKNLPLDNIEV